MAKTKYKGVYKDDETGQFYFDVQLGVDDKTGKRIRKRSIKDSQGRPFRSAVAANKEANRLRVEFNTNSGKTAYLLTYKSFMEHTYIPSYRSSVQPSTFSTRTTALNMMINHFGDTKLVEIDVRMVQEFKVWLLSESGYAQSYASLVFGMFRKTLEFAVQMDYLPSNVSKRVKAISKGKAIVPYWTKLEFEAVLAQICIDDYYEHLCYVMLWTYFMTGVRVNEGTALQWSDVDFQHKRLRVTHMLVGDSKTKYERHDYTKTNAGLRTITLDDDTISVLKEWKVRQDKNHVGAPDDFIFTYDGGPMLKSTLLRIIERYAKLAKVHRIQGKGLRHSHASYLINEFNVSVLVLSKRMGHSSPEVTLKHYAHMYSGADRELAKIMAGHVKRDSAKETKIVNFNGNQNLLRGNSVETKRGA
jgi:integrase